MSDSQWCAGPESIANGATCSTCDRGPCVHQDVDRDRGDRRTFVLLLLGDAVLFTVWTAWEIFKLTWRQ